MNKVLLTLPLALLLAGCGGTPQSSPTAPSVEAIPTSSATTTADAAAKSPRGNIVKQLGEGASITDLANDGREVVNFSVNSISPVTCTEEYAQPAENGHLIVVDATVETKPELAEATMSTYFMGANDFKFIADNGTTFNGNLGTGATFGCIPNAEQMPSGGMGPGEKVTGKVVLDVPAPTGILVLKAPFSSSNGWEYKF